jgi:hypothetical protein
MEFSRDSHDVMFLVRFAKLKFLQNQISRNQVLLPCSVGDTIFKENIMFSYEFENLMFKMIYFTLFAEGSRFLFREKHLVFGCFI